MIDRKFLVRYRSRALKKAAVRGHSSPRLSSRPKPFRAGREYLQAVLDSVNDAIFVESADTGQILDVNHRACEMYGYTYAQMLSVTIGDLSQGDAPYSYLDALQWLRKARQQGPQTFDWLARNSRNELFWVEISIRYMVISGENLLVVVVHDISARRRAEEQLRQSESALRQAQQISHVGSWVWDTSTNHQEWSDELYHIFEVERENFSGGLLELILSRIHPDDRASIEQADRSMRADKKINPMEFRIILPDGRVRFLWAEAGELVSVGADGRKVLAGTVQDITDRRQSEEALRRSDERFRRLFESAVLGVFQSTPEGKVFSLNPAYLRMFGYASIEEFQKTIRDVAGQLYVHPELRPAIMEKIMQSNAPVQVEVEYYRKDGSTFVGRLHVWKVYNQQGEFEHLEGFIEDITQRRSTEAALHASESRYRSLFEYSPTAMWEEDFSAVKRRLDGLKRKGVKNMRSYLEAHPQVVAECARLVRVLDVNHAAVTLYGAREKSELLGDLSKVIQGDSFDHFREELVSISEGITDFVWEGINYTLDGRCLDISLRWSNLPQHADDFSRVIVSIVDVTERKRSDESLRAAEAKLRALVEQVPAIVYTGSAEVRGQTIYISPQIETLTGYAAESWLKDYSWLRYVHPDDLDRLKAENERTNCTGDPFRVEYRVITRHGAVIWVHDEAVLVRDEAGAPLFWQGVMHDITDRKRAEQDVQRHLKELQAVYENGLAVSRALEPREIGHELVKTFSRLLSWQHVTVRLRRPDGDDLELVAFTEPGLTSERELEIEQRFNALIQKVGEGLSGWAAQTGQVIRVGNVREHPHYVDTHPAIRSGLYAPLKVGERVIGCISVESEALDAFSEQDERLLATLATQSAIAFENARLYQDAVREIGHRTILHRASQEIVSAGMDLESLYTAIHRAVTASMPGDVFTIALLDRSHQDILGVYLIERGKRYPPVHLKPGEGISGYVVQANRTLCVSDISQPRLMDPVVPVRFGNEETTRSVLAVPLRSGDEVIGAMSIQSYRAGVYTLDDQVLLEMLAAYAGNALEKSRLFEAERKQRHLSESLREALSLGASLNINLEFESVLDHLLMALEKVIPFDGGCIMLVQPENGKVRVARVRGYRKYGRQTVAAIRKIGFEISSTENLYWMYENKQPLVISDICSYTGWVHMPVSALTRSWAGAPIIVNGDVIAFFSLDSLEPARFTPEHVELLRAFTGQASLALQNALLFEQTRRRADEFAALYKTTLDLSGVNKLDTLLKTIVRRTAELLAVPGSSIYLYDKQKEELVVVAAISPYLEVGDRLKLGEGLAGHVAKTRQPYIVDDYQTWEGRSPRLAGFPFAASVQTPMLYGGDLIGVLCADTYHGKKRPNARHFTQDDLQWLSLLASSAAGAVYSARLLEETQHRAERLSALYEMSNMLGKVLDPDLIGQRVVPMLESTLGWQRGSLWLVEEDQRIRMVDHSTRGLEGEARQQELKRLASLIPRLGNGIIGWACQHGQSVRVKDVRQDERYVEGEPGIRSELCVPLRLGEKILGCLNFESEQEDAFSEQDEQLLSTLAGEISGAVERAGLYEQTRRRAEELGILADISFALRSAPTRDEMLPIILDQILKLTSAGGSAIVLHNPHSDSNEILMGMGAWQAWSGITQHPAEGISGLVISTGQAFFSDDIQSDERFSQPHLLGGLKYVACVPLIAEKEVIGALWVGQSEIFSGSARNLLNAIADIAANAIRRASLHEQTVRHAEHLMKISSASRVLTETLELPDVYRRLTDVIYEFFPDICIVFVSLYDEQVEQITCVCAHVDGKFIDHTSLPPLPLDHSGKGRQSLAVLSASPLIVGDLEGGPKSPVKVLVGDPARLANSAVYVPMIVQKKVIGLIQVQSYSFNRFSESDVELLGLAANTAAVAIENARLFATIQLRARQVSAVNELGRLLASTLDLPTIYRSSCSHIRQILDGSYFGITLYDDQKQLMKPAFVINDSLEADLSTAMPIVVQMGKAVEGRLKAIATAQSVILDEEDIRAERQHLDISPIERSAAFPKSAIYTPMLVEGRVIGLLELQSYQREAYNQEDSKLLSMIANQIGLSIQNARLFSETELRLQFVSALHTIDTAIASSLDINLTLNVILDTSLKYLRVDAAAIHLLNPHLRELEYVAGRGFMGSAIRTSRLRIGEGATTSVVMNRQPVTIADIAHAEHPFGRPVLIAEEKFVSYAAHPLVARGEVKGLLEVFHRSNLELDPNWAEYMQALAGQAALAVDNSIIFRDLQRANVDLVLAYDATIEGWSKALDLRDEETEGHTQRVSDLTLRLARQMGVDEVSLVHIWRGTLLHDIGKVGVPDAILRKAGPLTEEEWRIMRRHPVDAYELLSKITYLLPALDIPYCHHEKWDGSGYPRGLKREEIPLAARIFAVVDVWDALSSDRPYRKAWPAQKVYEYILSQSGTHFDPQVVDAFLRLLTAKHTDA